jgi:hypothetical protein
MTKNNKIEQIILYVDHLINNEDIGTVTIPSTIAYNNRIISAELVDEFTEVLDKHNEASHIISVGRYICSASISFENKYYGMFFIDLKNDPIDAIRIAARFDEKQTRDLFMTQFYRLKDTYKQNYNQFKLIKGTPPIE